MRHTDTYTHENAVKAKENCSSWVYRCLRNGVHLFNAPIITTTTSDKIVQIAILAVKLIGLTSQMSARPVIVDSVWIAHTKGKP